MPRFPVIPTLIVGLAIAAMIGLGFWQLERRAEKAALLAQLEANRALPEIAFPNPPVGDRHLFRNAWAACLDVVRWRHQGAGSHGYRLIAECRTGAEGPGLLVELGTTHNPRFEPNWSGGPVTGTIAHAPDSRPMLASLFGARERQLMLVADMPAPGLAASQKPDIASVPNNHLAYAGQWFFFAIVAGTIYLLALRRRQRKSAPAP